MGTPLNRARNIKKNSTYYMFVAPKAAINNPNRKKHELWVSQNARAKIFGDTKIPNIPIFNIDNQKLTNFRK